MGDEAASVVSEGLAHAPSLKEINMCGNSLTDRGIDSLLKKLVFKRSTIETINFANNDIGLHGCALLQSYMSDFKCRLQVLNLSHNNLHDAAIELLGAGIATNNSLRQLDLSNNSFGDRGAQAVAYALECTDCLEEVNLKWNHIKNEGAYWFVTNL
jgi:Ran GTPase-activating protein (RanGAP) involved in mRNA processing and transport